MFGALFNLGTSIVRGGMNVVAGVANTVADVIDTTTAPSDRSSERRRAAAQVTTLSDKAVEYAKMGDAPTLKKYLDEYPHHANLKYDGKTLLHFAALHGQASVVKLLLANPDVKKDIPDEKYGCNALQLACKHNHPDIAIILINANCNLLPTGSCSTLAYDMGDDTTKEAVTSSLFLYLVGKRNYINGAKYLGNTFLHYASAANRIDMVEQLLSLGAVIDVQNDAGHTPLHEACLAGSEDVVNALIESSCQLDIQSTREGNTALIVSCQQMDVRIVQALIRGGCAVNLPNYAGQTPFHIAVGLLLKENIDARGHLLDATGSPMQFDTPTDMFCLSHHRMKWKKGPPENYTPADLNAVGLEGETGVLCRMCLKRVNVGTHAPYAHCGDCKYDVCFPCYRSVKQAVANSLIDGRADINVLDKSGHAPITLAVRANNVPVMAYLVSAGCNINILNKDNDTPFLIAMAEGHDEAAIFLLDRDCKYPKDVIIDTAIPKKIGILKTLIKNGANVAVVRDGFTALHMACEHEYVDVANALIESQSSQLINALTNDEETALHICCRRNNAEIACSLIRNNADYSIRCATGHTALELGEEKTAKTVAEVILETRKLSTMPVVIADYDGLHKAEINGIFTPTAKLCNNRPVFTRIVPAKEIRAPKPKKGVMEVVVRMECVGSEWIILREIPQKKNKPMKTLILARMACSLTSIVNERKEKKAAGGKIAPSATNPKPNTMSTGNTSSGVTPLRECALIAYDKSLRPDLVTRPQAQSKKDFSGVWRVATPACCGVSTTLKPCPGIKTQSGAAARVSLPIHRELCAQDRDSDLHEAIAALLPQYASSIREKDFEQKTAVDIVLDKRSAFPHTIIYQIVEWSLPIDKEGQHVANHGYAWARLFTQDDRFINVIIRVLKEYQDHINELSAATNAEGVAVLDLGGPKCLHALQGAVNPCYLYLYENAALVMVKECLAAQPELGRATAKIDGTKMTMFEYSVHLKRSVDIIAEVLSYTLPFDRVTERPVHVSQHRNAWITALTSNNDMFVEVVSKVLTECSHLAIRLAEVKDKQDRKAVDIANPKCQELIRSRLYFYERYDLQRGGGYQSATCTVVLAIDKKDDNREVALKFMKRRDQFEREKIFHMNNNLDADYVVSLLRTHDSDKDKKFRSECSNKGYAGYPYCLVMPKAERTLEAVMASERICNREWDMIKIISSQLLRCLDHLHNNGLVHCDIKPLNIVRADGKYKLIDLDASVNYHKHQFAGLKFSTAYTPPEMIHYDAESNTYSVKRYDVDDSDAECARPLEPEALSYELVEAHPAHDMWAYGMTLYLLCTGERFFSANYEDNIDQTSMKLLYEWPEEFKSRRLAKVTDKYARNLISQLLIKDRMARITSARVLAHPFLSNKSTARMPGEEAHYDVFLSYRVASDAKHVEILYNMLLDRGLRVWWDKVCLEAGVPWEEGFCDGLVQSRAFVPLISREAIHHPDKPWQDFAQLKADSNVDNVFLEHRLALELRHLRLIEKIYPVMIGDSEDVKTEEGVSDEKVYTRYFRSSEPAKNHVAAVEAKVREHLNRAAIGEPMYDRMTVAEVYRSIMSNQGGFVEGRCHAACGRIADAIFRMLAPGNEKFSNEVPTAMQVDKLSNEPVAEATVISSISVMK